MNKKVNKRIFKSEIDQNLSYKELKAILKKEQRHDTKQEIKEIISNKLFAKTVFVICIGLNILFITVGILNYLGLVG
tara:strand:- start:2029 stop:2259 length:231 start_codon:yes stop_codon:yes gene_type:complete